VRRRWQTLARRTAQVGLVAVLLAYASQRVPDFVAGMRVLQIDRILVRGNRRLSTDDVLALLNGMRGQNLIRTDLDTWRDQLLTSPWVRDAELRRSLPSTVEVFLVEKEPMGIVRSDGRLYLVDDRGAVIDEYGQRYTDLDVPIIDGLSLSGQSAAANEPRVELAARVITALASKPEIARRVSQIDVRNLHDAAVILSGDAAVIRLGDRQFLQRLLGYLEVAPTLRERVPDIDRVDVRFDGRIYVSPMGRASKPETPARKGRR
jgi:cell division septal protein FtsQ